MPKKIGKVYLVGAGPGDLLLITLRGFQYLKEAEAIVYDRLINPELLKCAPESAEIIYVGKSPDRHTLAQDKINRLLVRLAKQGKRVVRLKGGDPFLFGRGAEEALTLAKNKIPFEIVPGVTSAIAVPGYAGIPLTHRGFTSSVGIFTGQEDPSKEYTRINWEKISTGLGTLVFLMGVENLALIVRNLIKFGRPKNTLCGLIQQGTLPKQKTVTANLATIVKKAKQAKIQPPAIFVVGEVVLLRKKINWFETKPLFGKKILVTAPVESSPRLLRALEDHGAACREFPLIKIKPLEDYSALDLCIKNIKNFHWLIFSSQNGVKFFKQRLDYLKKDVRILDGVNIAVIGPRTKIALEVLGLKVDIMPKAFCQEGLAESFKALSLKGRNILLVRAIRARDLLAKELKKRGAGVKVAPAYKAVPTPPRRHFASKDLAGTDIITFTSSSSVRNFFQVFPQGRKFLRRNKICVASIGPITSETIRFFGAKADIEAKSYTIDGLTEAIVKYYSV